MEPVKALLLGAGSRGKDTYAEFAKRHPDLLKLVGVAEPNRERREAVRLEHGIPAEAAFEHWEEAFAGKVGAEAVIIATQDQMHRGPILASIEGGYHILCEKPIVPTLKECVEIHDRASGYNKVFLISHVLRYTNFFSQIKELLESGKLGRLIGIDLNENVGHVHTAHSFVRGNWRRAGDSSPMILAKSCHDMDILYWLAGSECDSLSSYGALNHFRPENAPEGAPERCLDGCPAMKSCPYNAQRIYLSDNVDWPVNIISTDLSLEGRIAALKTGPWGRCVYRCDNDVVDHQVVGLRFGNGVTATFTMSGFTMTTHRNIKLMCTEGEILGDMEDNYIEVRHFSSGNVDRISVAHLEVGHSGGDPNLIADFVNLIRSKSTEGRTSAKASLHSHLMAFAAEKSRQADGKLVHLRELAK